MSNDPKQQTEELRIELERRGFRVIRYYDNCGQPQPEQTHDWFTAHWLINNDILILVICRFFRRIIMTE